MAFKMNPDEFDIDEALVKRLVATQFPQWDALAIRAVHSAGTDNAIYRLGDDMVVRLPRLARAVELLVREHHWLPRLAPSLPLAVPTPLASGEPDDEFPYPWYVYSWLPGDDLVSRPDVDMRDVAVRLGGFVAALRRIDPAGGPPSSRSGPLNESTVDERVRRQLRDLATEGECDAEAGTAVWRMISAAADWTGPAAWTHADLLPMNMLTQQGRLTAVIDFGLLGLGDPALDLQPAWSLLIADTRDLFRDAADTDDETWMRGCAWAFYLGVGAMHYYRRTNPVLAGTGRHAVAEAIAEYRRSA